MTIGTATDTFADYKCIDTLSAGAYDSTKCAIDSGAISPLVADGLGATGQNWTEVSAPADGNYCAETWDLTVINGVTGITHQRCVRLKMSAKRNMHTG